MVSDLLYYSLAVDTLGQGVDLSGGGILRKILTLALRTVMNQRESTRALLQDP